MKYFATVGLLVTAFALGCSDEREPVPPILTDGGTDVAEPEASVPVVDASVDTSRTDGFIDLFDVFPLPDAGCPGCIRDRCASQINACFNNPVCTQGLLCTVQMCAGGLLGDGGVDLLCVLGCFNGDQRTAFAAIGALTCVTMTCGSACALPEAGTPDAATRPDTGRADGALLDTLDDAAADMTAPDVAPPLDAAGETGTADALEDAISSPDATDDTAAPADTGTGNDAPLSDDAAADAVAD